MEPITGSIDDYVPTVQRSVLSLCKETGSEKIIIIAHSMGGLVARAYLREHGLGRIAKVITLGTPHHGTGVARYGVGLNCRQMHWNAEEKKGASSEWIRQLQESEDIETYRHVVSIYSHHDNIVSPQISSHLSGATNIEFYGIGHVALALHPKVQARVIAEIREASQNMTSVDTIVP
jgi:triacylglycerol esterase/lipase EstA (alpha/beta hydrolase family)